MSGRIHPVFPLGTVLFPGGVLPLRIFEPRYIELVARCTRADSVFIVCLARGDDDYHRVGTSARIVDFDQGQDGLLHIRCVGERRARTEPAGQEADGLGLVTVEWLAEPEPVPLPERHARLGIVLRNLIEQLDVPVSGPVLLDDAAWVSGRLAELLPLDPPFRQRLLEEDDPLARVEAIDAVLPTLASD